MLLLPRWLLLHLLRCGANAAAAAAAPAAASS